MYPRGERSPGAFLVKGAHEVAWTTAVAASTRTSTRRGRVGQVTGTAVCEREREREAPPT